MAVVGKYIKESDVDNWTTDTTQIEMQEIIDRVEENVEKITRDIFYPKTFHIFLDGNGKKQLFPFLNSRILSINKMSISDVEISTEDFTGDDILGSSGDYTITIIKDGITEDYYKNDYLGIYDVSEAINYYWGARIINNTATSSGGTSIFTIEQVLPMTLSTGGDTISLITNWDWNENSIYRSKRGVSHEPGELMELWEFYLNGHFPKGDRNVEVWGSMGHYTCPKQIKETCVILAKAENNSSLYSRQGFGIKSETLGDYSYSRFSASEGGKSLTGISEADQLLKNYIRKKLTLGAV